MSLMSSLYIGVSGLGTSQNSINTTAHNLSNVNTAGYVRQQVVQADNPYLNWGITALSTLQTGLGVNIATVRQIRDMFLDKSYRQEIGRQGFYEVQYEAVQEIESMFGEMEGVAFQNSLENLWTSLEELSKTPELIEARASVVQNAEEFIERATIIQDQLKEYQRNLNTQITDKVNKINDLAQQIYTLNKKICQYESSGVENANDLRDERNKLLDELGQIISISYKEKPNGIVTVTAEDVALITEDTVYKMGTAKVSESSNLLKPVWLSYGGIDVFNFDRPASAADNTDIGSLKGLLVARGDHTANYTDLNKSAEEYNKTINTSAIMTVQAQFDQLIHGIVTAINDILCPNKTITNASGKSITILDKDKAPAGMDENQTQGETLFCRKYVATYREPTEEEMVEFGLTKDDLVYNEEDPNDPYSLFTLGQIEVNKNIKSNYSLIPLSSNNGTGDVDMEAAQALVSKWNEPFATLSPNTLTKNTYMDYYTALIGELATRGQELKSISENQTTLTENIDDERQKVMGVSSDEELTNLIKYQHAYNASSRYITVIDEMLEHILSTLGR
ncbi:MAG: Flagellar hook-associated protein 1 [Lachnoclostridium sp.]|jgi:flagellar hook-associated protein 1